MCHALLEGKCAIALVTSPARKAGCAGRPANLRRPCLQQLTLQRELAKGFDAAVERQAVPQAFRE